MRTWNLKLGDPMSLTLAADARLGPIDYCDDQIWDLQIGNGEPAALALQTTYGLRARSLRIFPRFCEDDFVLTDPTSFHRTPTVHKFYPNYILTSYAPFPDLDVESEYWVPESHVIAGRLQIANRGTTPRQFRMDWVALLIPTEGQRMTPVEMQAAPVLIGSTGGLTPIIFLTGGPQPGRGPYPSLSIEFNLSPGESRLLTWSHAALRDANSSFELARQVAARPWEAEIARLELLNAGQIEIHTGDIEWDAAFAFTQKAAYGLFLGPTPNLPDASPVSTRLPDQGYSLRGDGSDYNYLWNGQTPLDAYYLSGILLPGSPDLVKGLIRNFLASQAENGAIDWKPGLGGQRSRLMATPLLASLVWRIYQFTEDRAFLDEVFTPLLNFIQVWFSRDHDRDEDGVPEWDHPMQTGFEEHPLFSRWHSWAQGVDISSAESPSLCAFLYCECQSLIHIANILDRGETVSALASFAEHMLSAVEMGWDDAAGCYQYWDRDTHYSTEGELLAETLGPGKIILQRKFEHPVRILMRIRTEGDITRRPQVFIHGESANGQHRIERISDDQIKWFLGIGTLTGERVYTHLEQIEIQGLDANDQVSISSVGYYNQDQTTLLPLWAKIPEPDKAATLIQETILSPHVYWQPYGIPSCPPNAATADIPECQSAHLPWNNLIGEGLMAYGYQNEAAELVIRLMNGIIQNLKQEGSFRRLYHTESGQGSGERNALSGLAPLGLFLEVLGVRIYSPSKVALYGLNPFPWPVTVKYRGMTVLRQKDMSTVIFPDGQTIRVDDPAPRIVTLESEPE
jgi:hypothetical protein